MNTNKLEEMLIRHEALKLRPYHCTAGKLTIGVGRNLEEVGITEAEAIFLLKNDIARVTVSLSKFKWFTQLNEIRRAVALNMAFNLGVAGFLKFKKMIAALEKEDYKSASDEMLRSAWALQVGKRADELAQMMKENRYV